ncbi:MAG TPA: UvrD-helicase domain-containing protein [Vicinamibacterales bacterium]|nr:UvrD-helicase domain-containing protein [Vicinamibacterales bacterium]
MQPSLFDLNAGERHETQPPDQAARDFATEPANDVVLEASAGTGKTRVLVDRYVRLIENGVDPSHILAMTFTRKAAAEMRERVLAALRRRHAAGRIDGARWRALLDRIADVQISTIDAFCFSLLREFPLEAGVEPGFEVADETEIGRFSREATDLALRAARGLLARDEALRLLFAGVRPPTLTRAVSDLLDRRHIALPAVAAFVKQRASEATAGDAAGAFVARLRELLSRSPHRRALLEQGPIGAPEYRWLHADLTALDQFTIPKDVPRLQHLRRRIERYFLTKAGDPRKKTDPKFKVGAFASPAAKKAHDEAVAALAPAFGEALGQLETAINAVLARGLLRLLQIAASKYETLLEEHALLDFAGLLDRSVALLSRQEEFARSRLKLQARYHHVLVDEFQDTSRLQWRLIDLLIHAWGEGEGASDTPTSIFIVGDRKQSIYRFRHAEVTLLDEAARRIAALRPGRTVRQAITNSFRAVPELLAFVNALSESIASGPNLDERFSYTDVDRFPAPAVNDGALRDGQPVLGLIAEPSMALCAEAVATEIQRLLAEGAVRTRDGSPRAVRPDDVAILFRARHGHQYFEKALEERGVRTYVYKGLGFFDAPEVQDLQALIRYLARPDSNLRAAELLRSRFVRLSDPALVALAPALADALLAPERPAIDRLAPTDAALLDLARASVARWLAQADRVPPSELVDAVIRESAYVFELRGRRLDQARENVKKVRALIRRVESRGYATLGRIAEYFETLRAGDESNAILEAAGSVQLMTMHAAKGLEFPIVFLVNLQIQGRGRSGGIHVIERGADNEPEVAFAGTDGTKLEDQRDIEELRRLLYVGVTRARDRLYLAAELDHRGQVRKSARSLASLLPASLLATYAQAAATPDADRVTWEAPAGRFTFRICRPGDLPSLGRDRVDETAALDVTWLEPSQPGAAVVTGNEAGTHFSGLPRETSPGLVSHPRLIGTIVHRLFQMALADDVAADVLHARALATLRADERVDVDDVELVAREAASLYGRLRQRADVRALLGLSGPDGRKVQVLYEVPFSMADAEAGATLRGVVDCLILPAGGPPVILEFKTGQPRPEHQAQVEQYARALGLILAVNHVETKILYA